MNWNEAKEGELKQVLDLLEEVFNSLDIDFYLIGAFAKDHWYARENKKMRQTKDVDFAIWVPSEAAYQQVKDALKEKGFIPVSTNAFTMLSAGGNRGRYPSIWSH